MAQGPKGPGGSDDQSPLNPEPLGVNRNPSLAETEQTAFPPEAGPGRPAVQINVEEDMAIGGGSHPVCESANTGPGHPRREKAMATLVAILVALFLAIPIIWLLTEIVFLSGILGAWLWLWVVLLVVLVVATVIIGFGVASRGF